MMSGGREVDVGGAVPDYKYRCNISESDFLTGQVEYSLPCEHLGSCLVIECLMMKFSTLFDYGPLPRPPDVIHMIGVPRPSPFFSPFRFRVLY